MKRLRKFIAAVAVLTISVSVMGCKMIEKTPEAIAKTVYATVGDTKITKADFDKDFDSYLRSYYGMSVDQLKQQYGDDYENNGQIKDQIKQIKQACLQNSINTQIMLTQNEIQVSDDEIDKEVEENISKLKEQYPEDGKFEEVLSQYGFTEDSFKETQKKELKAQKVYDQITGDIEVTDDDVQAYYDENKDTQYTQSAGANAAHILLAEKDSDGNIDFDASLKKAEEVKAKLDSGEDFATLASQYGTDGTKDKGGDLGYVAYNQQNYDQDFLDGFKALSEGQISDPVKSQFGYHIIKATGLKDSQVTPFDQVKDQIKAQLLQEKKNQAYQDKLKEWKETLKVKTYEDRM